MKRSASEIIRGLENRVARLENKKSSRWTAVSNSTGEEIVNQIDQKFPNEKPWRDEDPVTEGDLMDQEESMVLGGQVLLLEIESLGTNAYYAIISSEGRDEEVHGVYDDMRKAMRVFKSFVG